MELRWLGDCGFEIRYQDITFVVDPPAAFQGGADLVFQTRPDSFAGVKGVLEASNAKLVLPKSAAAAAHQAGIDFVRMTTTDADLRVEYFKSGRYARAYAVPSANPDPGWNALHGYSQLGYLLRFGDRTVYHGGVGRPYDGLAGRLLPFNVTVALLAVGPQAFDAEAAAQLAASIGAPWVAPMGSADVQPFVDHMLGQRPHQRFKVFQPGETWQVPA